MTARSTKRNRRGSLLVEVSMATVVLMIIMTVAIKILGFAAHERGASDRRQRAVLEAANVMERITANSFDEVTSESVRRTALPKSVLEALPGSELALDVTTIDRAADRTAKRITVRLRWRDRGGQWEAPVRLTSWIERRRARS
jgi:Tfp pilus assembly protein PilV